jgi:low temperature requirement protein LtrA
VRLALFALMLAGLVLSTSIPQAYAERGLAFALAYVAIQVGRTLFMLWAVPRSEVALSRNFVRILVWLSVSGVLWIAGGLAQDGVRLGLWGCAVAIEYAGPVSRFWTPGLGASTLQDWSIEGGHMAERCAAFIIIALGESVVVTGASFGAMPWSPAVLAAFLVAFVGSLAMWWVYFHKGAEAGGAAISHADDPGRLARLGYTYLHMPIVAGIIIAAAGDEIVLTHPGGHAGLHQVAVLVGGPLLFLVGTLAFKWTIHGLLQLSHLAGIAALVVLAPFGSLLSPLALSAATSLVIVVVAVWEARSIGRHHNVPARASTGVKRVH